MVASDRFTIGLTVGTAPPLRRVGAMVRLARTLGFDVAWTIDHWMGLFPSALWDRSLTWTARSGSSPHPHFDYQTLLGYLAPRAGNLQLAVGVTEPIRRHPVLLAQAALTLAHMTKRPPILGIGAGERENVTPYGLDFTGLASRVEEALEIIHLCFESEGPVSYQGRYFSLDGAVMDLQAPKGRRPEVWVASHQPRMLELTGRFGDGWYPTLVFDPDRYAAALGEIRAAARNANRHPDAVTPAMQAYVVVAKTEGDARRLLDSRVMRYMALLGPAELWRAAGSEHPLGADFRGIVDIIPERYERAELDAALASVPVDLVADSVVWGTPQQVEDRLRDFVDAGLRHLVAQPVSALVSRRDALFSLRAMISIQRRLKRGFPSPPPSGRR